MKAVYIEKTGGPEVLIYGDRPKPQAAAGQAVVKLAASGVNFIDTYHRSGLYKIPLPAILGGEGAGVVESVGEGVTTVKPGDRVAYATSRGAYAEYAAAPETALVQIPASVSFKDAAAVMLQGMTAHYLTHSTFPLKKGDTMLVHAAAGGTGRLIVQMAKMLGARVIGTAGSPAKAQIAREAGADEVILYREQDFLEETRRLTGGKGVDVVYDSVGATTFLKGLDCLRPRGMMVQFGNASGAAPAIEPLVLNQKGSLFLTRPTLFHYVATRQELEWRAGDLLRWLAEKKLVLKIDKVYPLQDAAQAQADLEGRKTSGKLVLEP
ncbi:MAG TPA: quinone oxidoreductase [Bryobacteraceae bacterium]|jgi:NADPH:quinone reductase|nr:quinone oxidoreductase [Bryobacteraceae bacterium]